MVLLGRVRICPHAIQGERPTMKTVSYTHLVVEKTPDVCEIFCTYAADVMSKNWLLEKLIVCSTVVVTLPREVLV